jgi:hypothetical protein
MTNKSAPPLLLWGRAAPTAGAFAGASTSPHSIRHSAWRTNIANQD